MEERGREEKSGTILFIDDDPEIVQIVHLILRSRNYEVLEATRGSEGIDLAKRETPDLILLDIMMPGIDGYEVYERLRRDEKTKDVPIVFVTAKARQEYVEQGLVLGAEGYLTKPFTPGQLLDTIRDILQPE